MKSFVATAILALAAAAVASNDAVVTSGAPFGVLVGGRIVTVQPFQVSIGGSARAAPRVATYYATAESANFGTAYSFCKGLEWNLATPKTLEDQKALEAVITKSGLGSNAWIGATCSNTRWTWLSDRTLVAYNNFPGNPTFLPPCGTTSNALMIFGNSPNYVPDKWFTWGDEHTTEPNHIICQA